MGLKGTQGGKVEKFAEVRGGTVRPIKRED